MASEATRLADFMYELRVSGYVYGAALTILAYETATNFTREIDLLLLRKRRPVYSCSIVLVLRWLPLAGMILAWVNNPPSICKFSIVTDQILYVFVCLAIALFGALRVCGLSEGKLKVALAVLVFLLTGVPGLSNLIIIARSTYTFLGPPFDTCLQQPIDSTRTITIISWVAGIATFSGNTLTLVVTWKKSFQQWRRCKGCGIRMSLSELLLRDGTLYFVIIGAMDLIQIVLISLQTSTSTATSIQPFLQVFPPIIICRFILNLQQCRGNGDDSTFSQATFLAGSVRFGSRKGGVQEMDGYMDWTGQELNGAQDDEQLGVSPEIPLAEICVEDRENVCA